MVSSVVCAGVRVVVMHRLAERTVRGASGVVKNCSRSKNHIARPIPQDARRCAPARFVAREVVCRAVASPSDAPSLLPTPWRRPRDGHASKRASTGATLTSGACIRAARDTEDGRGPGAAKRRTRGTEPGRGSEQEAGADRRQVASIDESCVVVRNPAINRVWGAEDSCGLSSSHHHDTITVPE